MSALICSIEDCDTEVEARGWCFRHYSRWRRHGDPHVNLTGQGVPAPQRFWPRVQEDGNGCWIWTGAKHQSGYGSFGDGGYAHRFSYEQMVGAIPAGLEIDHLCRVRACVNPEHLDPVTTRVNSHRGVKARQGDRCKRGHLYPTSQIGSRRCLQCSADGRRRRYHQKRRETAL